MTQPIGIALIGPPGVGKGTQAARLREEFGLTHIASGDLLREHRAAGSEMGRQAAAYMERGELVPDDLVLAMVHQRIVDSSRFLLDGFPRTLAQARALGVALDAEGRRLTAAVAIEAPDDVVVERIAGRADGRDDDRAATVRQRLEVFRRSTAPVIEFYDEQGILHRIDAARPIPEVYADARELLVALDRV
jgi:adenylate kinase